MKKYLSLLLTGTMLLSCPACGISGDKVNEGEAQISSTKEIESEERTTEAFDPGIPYTIDESEFDDYYESDFIKFPISSKWAADESSYLFFEHELCNYRMPNNISLKYWVQDPSYENMESFQDGKFYRVDINATNYYEFIAIRGGYLYRFRIFKGDMKSPDLLEPLAKYIMDNVDIKGLTQPDPTKPLPTEPPTPKPTEPPTKDPAVIEQEYKAKCQMLTYKDLARDREGLEGEYVTFTGEIIQDAGDGAYRMSVTKEGTYSTYYTDPIMIYYDDNGIGDRILVDDIVTIWGQSGGLYSYETVMGDTVTVPLVYVEYVELVQG